MTIRKQFDSKNLAHGVYDEEKHVLEITFQTGAVYRYKDVPEDVFNELCSAESAGRYFAANVKNAFDFERIS
jgi:hypothetical protein